MKFVSWNVNGLRACIGKGFNEEFSAENADFFCLQETKLQPHQIELNLPGYEQFWNSAERKGYSGTAIFTKHKPLNAKFGHAGLHRRRRQAYNPGIRKVLPYHLLHPQQQRGPCKNRLPHGI